MPVPDPLTQTEQELFADALELAPEGVLLFDRDFRILYANAVGRRISRIEDRHIRSQTHWELYPESVGTPFEEAYRRVMSTRVSETFPDLYYDPFKLWVSIRAVPVGEGLALYYSDVSDQHRISDEAARIADRFDFALQASNGVGAWDWDIVNDRVYADANFATLYGVDPAFAQTGAPTANFVANIHPDDAARVGAEIQETLRTCGNFVSEYRMVLADGSIRWLSTSGRVIPDAEGKPNRFPGVAVDITAQRDQAERLRLSEERYRILTELSPVSQWVANAQGLVLYANQRFLEYIGSQFVPKTGEEYIQCFDPADRERVVAVWTRSVLSGETYSIDARLLRASDGASRWWHLEALPLRNDDGTIQQWLGTATDNHDARLAAQRLHEQYETADRRRRELEAVYSGSPIGMALYEPSELRLTRINARQAEIFGRTPEECIGKTFTELTAGVTESIPLIEQARAGEPALNHDVSGTLNAMPGDLRYWNLNYTPIFDEDGQVSAVASATIELTAQKRAEGALVQAEKLAAVGRLASSIAHEINNPLEAVTNLIYLARGYAIVPEVQQFLDLAESELRRVAVIANGTLRFHKQSTRPSDVTCQDLFNSVMTLYEGRLKNSGVVVQKRQRAGRPVHCFEGDIRQVLNNLVGNAIDAMQRGGRLLLRSREATDWHTGRQGLVLTVADTGSGMPDGVRERIFEAFYTTKGNSGTGLGLWISKDIVARHAGRLLVRSSRNPEHHGTVFSLFLPYEIPADSTESKKIEQATR